MPTGTKTAKQKKEAIDSQVIRSSGNVFADLGIANPDVALAKADLVLQISKIIHAKKLNQKQAAASLGLDQPKISNLLRGKLDGFSIDRLLRFLVALGHGVDIVIRSNSNAPAEVRVLHG